MLTLIKGPKTAVDRITGMSLLFYILQQYKKPGFRINFFPHSENIMQQHLSYVRYLWDK